jgi:hypothetical protein
MNFSQALEELKNGKKIMRSFWGGYWVIEEWDKQGFDKSYPLIVAYLKDGGYAPAQAYQSDILADDWEVIE